MVTSCNVTEGYKLFHICKLLTFRKIIYSYIKTVESMTNFILLFDMCGFGISQVTQ